MYIQAIENKVAAKSKPKMKGKKEGKEGKKENKEPAPKKKTTKEADQKARVALGSGDITKVRDWVSGMLRKGLGLKVQVQGSFKPKSVC